MWAQALLSRARGEVPGRGGARPPSREWGAVESTTRLGTRRPRQLDADARGARGCALARKGFACELSHPRSASVPVCRLSAAARWRHTTAIRPTCNSTTSMIRCRRAPTARSKPPPPKYRPLRPPPHAPRPGPGAMTAVERTSAPLHFAGVLRGIIAAPRRAGRLTRCCCCCARRYGTFAGVMGCSASMYMCGAFRLGGASRATRAAPRIAVRVCTLGQHRCRPRAAAAAARSLTVATVARRFKRWQPSARRTGRQSAGPDWQGCLSCTRPRR